MSRHSLKRAGCSSTRYIKDFTFKKLLENNIEIPNYSLSLIANSYQMNTVKTHTLITRGVSKDVRNWLKRMAKEKRTSVNSMVLYAIDLYILTEAKAFNAMIKKSMDKS